MYLEDVLLFLLKLCSYGWLFNARQAVIFLCICYVIVVL